MSDIPSLGRHGELPPLNGIGTQGIPRYAEELSPETEFRLRRLVNNANSALDSVREFCYFNNVRPATLAKVAGPDNVQVSNFLSQFPCESSTRQITEIQKSLNDLQFRQNRLIRALYGSGALPVRDLSLPWTANNIEFEPKEIIVTVLCKTPIISRQVSFEVFIVRNQHTSIASLEAYSLDKDERWQSLDIPKCYTPLGSVDHYIQDQRNIHESSQHFHVVTLDAAFKRGFIRHERCFCDPRYKVEYASHETALCVCQRVASNVLAHSEETVTRGSLLGEIIDTTGIPPETRGYFFKVPVGKEYRPVGFSYNPRVPTVAELRNEQRMQSHVDSVVNEGSSSQQRAFPR